MLRFTIIIIADSLSTADTIGFDLENTREPKKYNLAAGETVLSCKLLASPRTRGLIRSFSSGSRWIGFTSGSLSWRCRCTRLPMGIVAQILKSIASALDYVHVKGLVHRDIRPGRLFTLRSIPQALESLTHLIVAHEETPECLVKFSEACSGGLKENAGALLRTQA